MRVACLLRFVGFQIGYSFVSGYSGVSMFDSLCVAAYNALLFVPVVFFFVDKDLSEPFLVTYPEAYMTCREGLLMNYRTMFWWFLRAFVQVRSCVRSVVAFSSLALPQWAAVLGFAIRCHVCLERIVGDGTVTGHCDIFVLVCCPPQSFIVLSIGLSLAPNSLSDQYECLGLLIFNGYLLLQDITMLLELRTVTMFNIVSVFGLHLIAIIALIIINLIPAFVSFVDYFSFNVTLDDPAFWFGNVLIAVAALMPIEGSKAYLFNWVPTNERLARYKDVTYVF